MLNFVFVSFSNASMNKLLGLLLYWFIKNLRIICSGVFRKQLLWGVGAFYKGKNRFVLKNNFEAENLANLDDSPVQEPFLVPQQT